MSQPPVGKVRHQQHQQHQQQYSTPVDIKAVPGLRVCTNFFTHRIENTLYHDSHFFPHSERRVEQIAATQRRKEKKGSTITKCVPGKTSGGIGHFGDDNDPIDEDDDDSDIAENDSQKPNNHNKNTNDKQGCPDVLLKLCNGVIESGLEPELFFAPNNCVPVTFPNKSGSSMHCDSRRRFGEVIVGVTLGSSIILKFSSKKVRRRSNNNMKKKEKKVAGSIENKTKNKTVNKNEMIVIDDDSSSADDNTNIMNNNAVTITKDKKTPVHHVRQVQDEEEPKPVEYTNRETGLQVKVEKEKKKNGGNKWSIYVLLPARTVYCLTGPARYEYNHGVISNTGKGHTLFRTQHLLHNQHRNPSFHHTTLRRMITLRSTRSYSDELLARYLRTLEEQEQEQENDDADDTHNNNNTMMMTKRRIIDRINHQNKFRPQHGIGKDEAGINEEQIANHRVDASRLVSKIHVNLMNHNGKQKTNNNNSNLVFTKDERGYKIIDNNVVDSRTKKKRSNNKCVPFDDLRKKYDDNWEDLTWSMVNPPYTSDSDDDDDDLNDSNPPFGAASGSVFNTDDADEINDEATTPNNTTPAAVISCWPLGTGKRGKKPSPFVGKSAAIGFHWGLKIPSDLLPDGGSTTEELEQLLEERKQQRRRHRYSSNITPSKTGVIKMEENEQQQLEEALRQSIESKKREDSFQTKTAARRHCSNSSSRKDGTKIVTTASAKVTPSSTAASTVVALSREVLRAKRLAVLDGGGNTKRGATTTVTNTSSSAKRKSSSNETIEILSSSDEEENNVDGSSMKVSREDNRKPAATKKKKRKTEQDVQNIIELE